MNVDNNTIVQHFDAIAKKYDNFKEDNSYYYGYLKELYKKLIPDSGAQCIIELGCGSGEILNFLNPNRGVGVDISPNMISVTTNKFRHKDNLRFFLGSIDDTGFMKWVFSTNDFDYCIIPDTIEHVSNIHTTFSVLSRVIPNKTMIIVSWANPIWSPFLHLLELLKLKMPEGPHRWPSMGEMLGILRLGGYQILDTGCRIAIPFYIPLISNLFNSLICRTPILRKICLVQYIQFKNTFLR